MSLIVDLAWFGEDPVDGLKKSVLSDFYFKYKEKEVCFWGRQCGQQKANFFASFVQLHALLHYSIGQNVLLIGSSIILKMLLTKN